MSAIAFLLEHEEGHLYPAFKLARQLMACGHRVLFLGLADAGDLICAQGFDFVPILEHLFPRGSLRSLREMSKEPAGAMGNNGRPIEIALFESYKSGSVFAKCWREIVCGKAMDDVMRELQPSLFLMSTYIAPFALALHYRYQIPVVLLTPNLRQQSKAEHLGLIEGILAAGLPGSGEFIRLVRRSDPMVRRLSDLTDRLVRTRELILCPKDLELPGEAHDNEPEVHYVEAAVDLDRKSEVPFPWERLDPDRRLLYVSLGSQSFRAGQEQAVSFLRAAAGAFSSRPEWQVILSTGGLIDPEEIPASPGVTPVSWAPQLELLRRASIMITHGGLGAVKECICTGVPMVVFPITRDQPANARRVVHHHLGLSGQLADISAEGIAALVDEVDRAPIFRENVRRMQRRFLEVEEARPGVRLIEEVFLQERQPEAMSS